MTVLGTSLEPYANIWVGEAEGTTDVSCNHLQVAHVTGLYSFERIPSQTSYAARLLDRL